MLGGEAVPGQCAETIIPRPMLPDVPYAVYPGGQHIGTAQDFVGFIYLSLVNIRERPPEDETAPLRSNMGDA